MIEAILTGSFINLARFSTIKNQARGTRLYDIMSWDRSDCSPIKESRLYSVSRPDDAESIVVFVHGIAAHFFDAWGQNGNPGAFAIRLAEEFPQVAVAMSSYPASISDYLACKSINFDAVTGQWAGLISNTLFGHFRKVVIVGHCLGGHLATAALRYWLTSSDAERAALPQLTYILLDSPHELPASGPSDWLSGLMRAIGLTNNGVAEVAEIWRDAISKQSPLIRAYAVVGKIESWVTPLNPECSLPPDCVDHVSIPHEDLTKAPMSDAFLPYEIVSERLRASL